MGIYIHLDISKSVTQERWEIVYEETLQLINHFPLADRREVEIHGIPTICLTHSGEYEETDAWDNQSTRLGWCAIGDMEWLKTAEEHYTPRDLIKNGQVDTEVTDAAMGALPIYCNSYEPDAEVCSHTRGMWGRKTQGEPYHISLLAVAALIEARLGIEAFTTGDITRGQFKKAVEEANKYLENKIDMPDRCYMDRWFNRVIQLPVPGRDKVKIFIYFYLGEQNADFGAFLRSHFSAEDLDAYWHEKLKNIEMGTHYFGRNLREYLLWGFELGKMCEYTKFHDEEGNQLYDQFVRTVMECKLHIAEKNCHDPLQIDQEAEYAYGIGIQMAQVMFAGGENKKVDRYIPIEIIRQELVQAIGDHCDVNAIIDKCLEEEEEIAQMMHSRNQDLTDEEIMKVVNEVFSESLDGILESRKKEWNDEREKYDICFPDELVFFKKGITTVHPDIQKAISHARQFVEQVYQMDRYKRFSGWNAKQCCEWLVDHNDSYLLREQDWDNIFSNIENNPNSFGRYYGLMIVKINSSAIFSTCLALLINDDLYEYAGLPVNNE